MQTSLLTAAGAALLCMALSVGPASSAPQGAMPSAPSAAQGQGPDGMTGGREAPDAMPQGHPDAPGSSANAPSDGNAMDGRQGHADEPHGKADRKAAGTEQPADRDAQGREHDRKATMDSTDRERGATADKAHGKKEATARIDSEQKEKVRSYFSKERPTANRVEKGRVRVSIGIGIPASIVLAPLPAGIVVVAGNCPLQYFVWGDDIVLVDSCSRHVVDIIPNIG